MEISVTKVFLLGIIYLPMMYAIQEYEMHDHCGEKVSMNLKSAHQLELELTDNYIYSPKTSWFFKSEMPSCEITVAAWQATYTKLMFYFDEFDLDCDEGHLEFFDGENENYRVPGLANNICGDRKPSGIFSVSSPYLLIKYVPGKTQYIRDIFSIIVTAYRDDICPSFSHKCDNTRCISKDIACNGYDSCGDGSGCDDDDDDDDVADDSDEAKEDDVTGIIIGAIVGSLAVIVFIIFVVLCVSCNRKTGKSPRADQYQQSPVPMTVSYTASGQRIGYSQPVYGVNHGSPDPASQVYPIAPVGVPPTAPVPVGHQVNYQAIATVSPYGGELPLSPPPYLEPFGQPDHTEPPRYHKEDHVYADIDDASALHAYENSKQAS